VLPVAWSVQGGPDNYPDEGYRRRDGVRLRSTGSIAPRPGVTPSPACPAQVSRDHQGGSGGTTSAALIAAAWGEATHGGRAPSARIRQLTSQAWGGTPRMSNIRTLQPALGLILRAALAGIVAFGAVAFGPSGTPSARRHAQGASCPGAPRVQHRQEQAGRPVQVRRGRTASIRLLRTHLLRVPPERGSAVSRAPRRSSRTSCDTSGGRTCVPVTSSSSVAAVPSTTWVCSPAGATTASSSSTRRTRARE